MRACQRDAGARFVGAKRTLGAAFATPAPRNVLLIIAAAILFYIILFKVSTVSVVLECEVCIMSRGYNVSRFGCGSRSN